MPQQGMSRAAYARRRGVTPAAVTFAAQSGRIPTHPDGSIDPEAADIAWKLNTDTSKGGQNYKAIPDSAVNDAREALGDNFDPSGPMSFMEAKTAEKILQAAKLKIEVAALEGDLVPRDEAESRAFSFARQVRDAWLTFPSRVSALMAAELGADAHKVQALLDRFVRENLEATAGKSYRANGDSIN